MADEKSKPTVSIIGTDTRDALTAAFEAGKATKQRVATLEKYGKSVPVQISDSGIHVLDNVIAAWQAQRPGPVRRKGTSHHSELDSIIAYVLRFRQAASVIWANLATFVVVAVLDYHPEGIENAAGWQCHRAEYACPRSRERRTMPRDSRAAMFESARRCAASMGQDARELARFDLYVRRVADLESHGEPLSAAQRTAYTEVYGEVVFDLPR